MKILLSFVLLVSLAVLSGCGKKKPTAKDSEQPPTAGENQEAPKSKRNAREEKAGFSLKDYAGEQPVLILFADSSSNDSYKKFNAGLAAQQSEIKRHDLVIIDVLDHKTSGASAQIRGGRRLHDVSTSDLVDMYGVGSSSFIVALIGKDGKTALHSKGYIEPGEVLGKLSDK